MENVFLKYEVLFQIIGAEKGILTIKIMGCTPYCSGVAVLDAGFGVSLLQGMRCNGVLST